MQGWAGIVQGNGLMVMFVGMVVVFTALVLLMLMMKALKRYEQLLHLRKQTRATAPGDALAITGPDGSRDISGVVVAAIALTLILEEESVHDEESLVLTLQAIPKPYSNWWQDRIERFWPVRISQGQQRAWKTTDLERGSEI